MNAWAIHSPLNCCHSQTAQSLSCLLHSGFCPRCSLCRTGVLREIGEDAAFHSTKSRAPLICGIPESGIQFSNSLSLPRRSRIQTRPCHSSGFPTLLELESPVGKKMYNHWIRWCHHVCAPWSRAGFPHLKGHAVVWHFSGFVANDVILFIPIFSLRIWGRGVISFSRCSKFSVKSLQLWNQPNIYFPPCQELLTCRVNPASWLVPASRFCWMFHRRWGKGSVCWELKGVSW